MNHINFFRTNFEGRFSTHLRQTSPDKKSLSRKKKDKGKEAHPDEGHAASHLYEFSDQVEKKLAKCGIIDLTTQMWEQSVAGRLNLSEPVCFGRDRDLQHLTSLLNTTMKPANVIVTGTTGVGKSVLIDELARQILTNPKHPLAQCRVLIMSRQSAKLSILTYLAENVGKKAILVFDECHDSFTGLHFDVNSLSDLSNVLDGKCAADAWKPLLAQNELRIVGMTDRMGRFLEQDPARKRRFSHIQLKELDIMSTIHVIRQKKFIEKVNQKYQSTITISDDALTTAIYLAMSYYPKLSLPASAFDVLDPAVAWWLNQSSDFIELTSDAIIEYMMQVEGFQKEELEEHLSTMIDLATSPIPPHEPLSKCTINLSSKARRGKLAPAWGRAKVLRTLSGIFSRNQYNNALVTAPPGSGKSRLAEGLAWAIQNGDFPHIQGKEVLLLDWKLAQEDLPKLIKSAEMYREKFILIIDEAHRLVGPSIHPQDMMGQIGSMMSHPAEMISTSMSGLSAVGGVGGFEDLKMAMGRGAIPSLILTTKKEAASILKDQALMRRVQPVELPNLSKKQIMQILKKEISALANAYGFSDKLVVSRKAREAIFYLSELYLADEYQPSAAFKLLHTVFAHAATAQVDTIQSKTVFQAVAAREGLSCREVKEAFKEELISDHPSSRRIPSNEPLMRFTTDWTKMARKGLFPDYIGHADQLHMLETTLARATCNNALIIGPTGSGKSTLIKMLAQKMAFSDGPNADYLSLALRDKPLLAVDMKKLKGHPEMLSEFLNSALQHAGNYVLFMDEVHVLFGNASPIPGLNLPSFAGAFEDLKPLLAEGKITLIGATTPQNFDQCAKDDAMRRRFKMIFVDPPTPQEAEVMLMATKDDLESQMSGRLGQSVVYRDATIGQAVTMADPDRLPASAVSLLEVAAIEQQAQINDDDAQIVVTPRLVQEEEISDREDEMYDKPQVRGGGLFSLLSSVVSMFGRKSSRPRRRRRAPRTTRRSRSAPGRLKRVGQSIKSFFMTPFRKFSSWHNS